MKSNQINTSVLITKLRKERKHTDARELVRRANNGDLAAARYLHNVLYGAPKEIY